MKKYVLLVNVLLNWSDMSIEKKPHEIISFWGRCAIRLRYRYSSMILVF